MNHTEKSLCSEIRKKLHESFDRSCEPQGEAAAHLKTCSHCRSFWAFLKGLGPALEEKMDKELRCFPPADFNALFSEIERHKRRSKKNTILRIAAVLVLGIGITLGVRLYDNRQTRLLLNESCEYIVQELFNKPLLEDVEYAQIENFVSLSDWFTEIAEGKELY